EAGLVRPFNRFHVPILRGSVRHTAVGNALSRICFGHIDRRSEGRFWSHDASGFPEPSRHLTNYRLATGANGRRTLASRANGRNETARTAAYLYLSWQGLTPHRSLPLKHSA